MSSLGKVVGTIALLLAGTAGLLMSLCGGVFTFAGLTARGMSEFLVISVPSLLGGAAIVWFAIKKFREGLRRPPES